MKKYINLKSFFFAAMLIVAVSCDEDQDVEPIISTSDYPTPSFTFTGGSTDINESEGAVYVYDIVLDKPLLRSVDISAIQVGGTATEHEDFEVINATIPPYSTTGQITIMILNDAIVEGDETLELEIQGGPALSNKYLLNPDADWPSLSITIRDWVFCLWTLDSRDTYGDGWNGGHILLETEGESIQYATDGSQTLFDIPVTVGADYTFTYVSGGGTGGIPGWESENYYLLTGPDGTEYEDGTQDYSGIPTPGVITTGTSSCN